mmetsp:Transcript_4097/g.8225  ORF Transcript_4097/g.8225 Transcript_4097/m.8225 type:complete len:103 (-) Transcript_4097:349-657(-)
MPQSLSNLFIGPSVSRRIEAEIRETQWDQYWEPFKSGRSTAAREKQLLSIFNLFRCLIATSWAHLTIQGDVVITYVSKVRWLWAKVLGEMLGWNIGIVAFVV